MTEHKTKISNILRSLDVFGQPVILYVKGKASYKTSAGGFITLTLFIITLTLFGISLNTLIQRVNITIQEQTQYQATPPFLNFTNDNFIFSFGMDDPNITPNNSLFSYDITLETRIHENSDTENVIVVDDKIQFGVCKQDIYSKFAQFNKPNLLARSFCPTNYSYHIQGTPGDKIYRHIRISINKCVNGTHPDIICAPQDDINHYFKNTSQVKFRLYFVNQNIDLYNFDNLYQSFIDNQLWLVSPLDSLARKSEIFFRSTRIEADDDLLGIYGPKTYETHTFMQDRYDWAYVPLANSSLYFDIELKSSYYQTISSRTYGTFLQTLSFIGGIFNLLHLALGIIAGFVNEHAYRIKLANMLYGFDAEDLSSDQDNHNKRPHDDNSKQIMSNKSSEKIIPRRQIIKNRFDKLKELRTALIYPTLHYLSNKISCCFTTKLLKKKEELFNLAIKKFSYEIDIEHIMKKLHEIEKLKNILLTSDQLGMFNFVEPQIISTRKARYDHNDHDERRRIVREDTLLLESGNDYHHCKDLKQYYKHSKMYSQLKNEPNSMNENLLLALNPEVREIFDLIDESDNMNNHNTIQKDEILLTENGKNKDNTEALRKSNDDNSNDNDNGNNNNEIGEKAISPNMISNIENEELCLELMHSQNEIMDKDNMDKPNRINKVKVNEIINFEKLNSNISCNQLSP